MKLWDFFRRSGSGWMVTTPLTPGEVQQIGRTMAFRHAWTCKCGAQLTIRAREDRATGDSNFVPVPPDAGLGRPNPKAGHSTLPPLALTWNGLAEERGWKTQPVKCPACQRRMTVADYKQAKRDGAL